MDMELYVAYRRQLLWTAAVAVDCVAPGGCLVLRLGHMLTSFSSTLFYLLHRCGTTLGSIATWLCYACYARSAPYYSLLLLVW